MIHRGKEIYRRLRISNQIFDSIYVSRDIDRSLDTTLTVFSENLDFMDDEYLKNRAKLLHAVFADCSILISSTFWSVLKKSLEPFLRKSRKTAILTTFSYFMDEPEFFRTNHRVRFFLLSC